MMLLLLSVLSINYFNYCDLWDLYHGNLELRGAGHLFMLQIGSMLCLFYYLYRGSLHMHVCIMYGVLLFNFYLMQKNLQLYWCGFHTAIFSRFNAALSNCCIGDSCVIHNGVCIGQDGKAGFLSLLF